MTYRTARCAAAALACAAALALTGCGADDSADDEQPADDAAPTSASPSSEAASEDAAPLRAACKLKANAGGNATLEQTGDGLVMTFVGLPVPSSGEVLYSVTAFDAAGEQGGQLGVKYQDGEQIAYFVFDFGTAEQTNLEGSPQVSGDALTGVLPGC